MAAVVDAVWGDGGEGNDIHVLRPQKTRTLDNLLTITDDGGNTFTARERAKWPGAGITAIQFIPIFPFNLGVHGISVDPDNGQVTTAVLPPLPPPRLTPNNFIIRARITGPGANPSVVAKIRVHVHNTVVTASLTPNPLTVRQESPPLPPLPPTTGRFTVLAQFDDGVLGNISHHGDTTVPGMTITWRSLSPGDASIDARGFISARNAVAATRIEATLPAEFGGATIAGTVQNALPWQTPLAAGTAPVAVPLPGSANPGAPDQMTSFLFISDGFTAAEERAFRKLVRQLVTRWKRSRSTRPFDLVPMNYYSLFVPSRQPGSTVRNLLQLVGRRAGHRWARAVPTPVDFTPGAGNVGSVDQLIHQVGLPIPAEADPAGANWRAKERDWHALYGAAHVGNVDFAIYQEWANLADYLVCFERDTAFGLATGFAPEVQIEDDGRVAQWHPFRAQRTDLDQLLGNLVIPGAAGVNVGATWLTGGRNRPFVFALMGGARWAGGRVVPPLELITSALVADDAIRIQDAPMHQIASIVPHGLPATVGNDMFATFTHEGAHAVDLLDEYGGVEAITANGKDDVRSNASNLQVTDDTIALGILWKWPRITAAGIVIQDLAGPGAAFAITLRHPHGRAFAAGNRVRLRQRPFLGIVGGRLTYLPESNDLEVDGPPMLNMAGDVVRLRVVGGGVLNPPNWAANATLLFKPQGTLIVQVDVEAFITGRGRHIPLNRSTAACVADDRDVQKVDAAGLIASLKRGKPRYRSWIHGIYDGGSSFHCGVFHPSGACLMRALLAPAPRNGGTPYRFCHVCRYVMVDKLDPTQHGVIDRDYQAIYPERR